MIARTTVQQAFHGLRAIAIAVVFVAQGAWADTIELNTWWGGHGSASISLSSLGVNYNNGSVIGGSGYAASGGACGFRTYNLTVDPARRDSFESWCVDIFHDFSFAVQSTDTRQDASAFFSATLGAASGARIADDLGRLATNHYADVTTTVHNTTTDRNAVAFQLAVWEIVNENAGFYGLGTGNFRVTSATSGALALATTWLGELAGTTNGYSVDIWAVSNGAYGRGAQDVAIFAPIPEPEIYAMLAIGFGVMGFAARRRRQQAAAA